jgi:hypothetical protein
MTYPMSPSKRVLLPRREGAVTVGYRHARDDAKNSRFFRWERAEAEARYTPRRRDRRYRARREGSWEGRGGESCWRRRQRRALWRTRGVTTMEIAPSCGVIYVF